MVLIQNNYWLCQWLYLLYQNNTVSLLRLHVVSLLLTHSKLSSLLTSNELTDFVRQFSNVLSRGNSSLRNLLMNLHMCCSNGFVWNVNVQQTLELL